MKMLFEGRCISLIGAADQNLKTKKYITALRFYNDYLKEKPQNTWAVLGKIEALWFISDNLITKRDYKPALKKIDDALNSSEDFTKI